MVWMVDAAGKLVDLGGPAFHWMTLDSDARFAGLKVQGSSFEFVAKAIDGGVLILSSDFPVALANDFLYFAPYAKTPPLRVMRLTREGRTEPAAVIETRSQWFNGLARGREGLYFTEDAGVKKLTSDGSVSVIAEKVMLGIYWNNHHHMLHASSHVTGGVLWANLHLLFWLSLVPFVTAWMGHHPGKAVPIASYAAVLLMDAVAYTILERLLISAHGPDSKLARAVGHDTKGLVSLAAYVTAIPAAFVLPAVSYALIVFVAVLWLVPDRRIERQLRDEVHQSGGRA
jgi:hypothetical protein